MRDLNSLEGKILPEVGMEAILTKIESNIDWVDSMDKFDGLRVKIKRIYKETRSWGTKINAFFEEIKEYPDLNHYNWCLNYDHFTVLSYNKKVIKLNLKAKK